MDPREAPGQLELREALDQRDLPGQQEELDLRDPLVRPVATVPQGLQEVPVPLALPGQPGVPEPQE